MSGAELTPHAVVAPAARVEFRKEGDEGALLYDPDSGRVAVLNPTAASVWEKLDGRRTVAEVTAALAAEYEDMGTSSEAQVLAVVQAFVDRGAAQMVSPG